MNKNRSAQELKTIPFTVPLKAHIIDDLKLMERHSKKSIEELVTIALLMFIATHNDYLCKNRP